MMKEDFLKRLDEKAAIAVQMIENLDEDMMDQIAVNNIIRAYQYLRKENKRLKEFEWKYKELCK